MSSSECDITFEEPTILMKMEPGNDYVLYKSNDSYSKTTLTVKHRLLLPTVLVSLIVLSHL